MEVKCLPVAHYTLKINLRLRMKTALGEPHTEYTLRSIMIILYTWVFIASVITIQRYPNASQDYFHNNPKNRVCALTYLSAEAELPAKMSEKIRQSVLILLN